MGVPQTIGKPIGKTQQLDGFLLGKIPIEKWMMTIPRWKAPSGVPFHLWVDPNFLTLYQVRDRFYWDIRGISRCLRLWKKRNFNRSRLRNLHKGSNPPPPLNNMGQSIHALHDHTVQFTYIGIYIWKHLFCNLKAGERQGWEEHAYIVCFLL